MDINEKIKSEIAAGNLDKAIQILTEVSANERKDLSQDVIMLQSRYRKWKRERNLGVINEDVELRKIEYAILNIIKDDNENNSIEDEKPEKQVSVKSDFIIKGLKLIGVVFIVVGCLLLIFRFDIILELVKGTKIIEYKDLLTPLVLISTGSAIFLNFKKIKS